MSVHAACVAAGIEKRKELTPLDRARKAIAALSAEERAVLLAELMEWPATESLGNPKGRACEG
jgi:hypothetical protein